MAETTKEKALLVYQIPMLRSKNTVTHFGTMLKEGSISWGCMLFCQLHNINIALKDCEQQLTLIIIDYNLNRY